ncbi:unnamed protein product [Hydatigera taeniaeformis]|uniref:BAH domain-containing protein n=1 Tax=Hydatigena taeniaeformis TaxID=6205 RepID=A0A0R3X328_HYDTA|nr:unnamed protein product [Hydatigera taeniaeformis]
MAKKKVVKKNYLTCVKSKTSQNLKSRKKSVYRSRLLKNSEPPISYKESHSIGRRQSTHVPTYSESGRLYYDLYVKYGLTGCFSKKDDKLTKEHNHAFGFESDVSDTTTVACNEASGNSLGKRTLHLKKKKKQVVKRNRIVALSPQSSASYTRREASLNAEAKVNMLFESSKECKLRRRSLPSSLSSKVTEDVPGPSNENTGCVSSRRRVSRLRASDPPVSYSPPRKRLAGLNAMAIISAFMKSPKSAPSADVKPRRRGKQPKISPTRMTSKNNSFVNTEGRSSHAEPSNQLQTPTQPSSLSAAVPVSNDTKLRPSSAVPTVERFQSHKVISYGSKCIGVENISRQIIHVPSQSQSLPGPSCPNPVPQRIFTPPCSSSPPRTSSSVTPAANVSPQQNQSMIVFPDTSFSSPPRSEILLPADVHTCFPSHFYLSPFNHTSALQPHAFFMSPTLIHSMPSSPFHFLHTSPFTTYMHSPTPMATNYMLPMPVSPVYNAFSHGGFGSCIFPRPVFSTQPMPSLAPSAPTSSQPTALAYELGNSQAHSTPANEPPKRVDRAVSPMPEIEYESAFGPACTVQVKKSPIKRASLEKKQVPCLWVWEGTPSERPVFVKPDSPPVARMCYSSMRHEKDGMVVCPGDNVLLCSGPDRHSAPHVAKVTALFDNPDNGEENVSDFFEAHDYKPWYGTKMMALLWYYRPDSLTPPRRSGVVECELFASRHCDVNPVDCIDDRAYVLSSAPYARFMALAKYKQEARTHRRPVSAVPQIPISKSRDIATFSANTEAPSCDISEFPEDATPSNVFLCRAWYDFRSRRVIRHLKSLNSNLDNGDNSNNGGYSNSNKPSHRQQERQLDVSGLVHLLGPNPSSTLLTPVPPSPPLQSPSVSPPEKVVLVEETAETEQEVAMAESAGEISNGQALLEKTADIALNWREHREQVALSLGSAPLSPSPKKSDTIPVTSPSSSATPASASDSIPTPASQPPHILLSSSPSPS